MAVDIGTLRGTIELNDQFTAKLQAAGNAMDGAGKQWDQVGKKFSSAGMTLLPVSLAVAGVGVAALKMATDLNASIANVSALLTDLSGPDLDKVTGEMKTKVQGLAVAFGKSTTDLSGGLYEVIGSLGHTKDTFGQLEISAKAGAAGLATTQEAFNFLSSVTKSYGDTSEAAFKKVGDLGFQAVNLGQTTFPALAASIGGVAPIAKVAGVSMEEMFAVIATATGVTGNTSEVVTQMASAMNALLKPSEEMKDVYGQLHVKSGEAMIAQFGFVGALQQVAKYAKDTETPLMDLLGRKEAFILTASLAGEQATKFGQNLGKMGEAATASGGVVDAAFKKQTEGINKAGFAWEQFKAQAQVAMQNLGDALIPIVLRAAEALKPLWDMVQNAVKAFTELPQPVQTVIVAIGGIAAAIAPVLIAIGSLVSIGGVALGGLGVAFAALVSPIGLVVIAIATIGTGLLLAYRQWSSTLAKMERDFDRFQKSLTPQGRRELGIADIIDKETREIAQKALEMGKELDKLPPLVNGTVVQLKGFGTAAAAAGKPAEDLGTNFKKLGEGSKEAGKEAAALVKEIRGLTVLEEAQKLEAGFRTALSLTKGELVLTREQKTKYIEVIQAAIDAMAAAGPAGAAYLAHFTALKKEIDPAIVTTRSFVAAIDVMPAVLQTVARRLDGVPASITPMNKALLDAAREGIGQTTAGLILTTQRFDQLSTETMPRAAGAFKVVGGSFVFVRDNINELNSTTETWRAKLAGTADMLVSVFKGINTQIGQTASTIGGAIKAITKDGATMGDKLSAGFAAAASVVQQYAGASVVAATATGALSGAAAGAAFGALFSGVSMGLSIAIGAAVGGLVGLFGSMAAKAAAMRQANKDATESIKEMQKQLLDVAGSLEQVDAIGKVLGVDLAAAWGSQGQKGLEHFTALIEEFQKKQKALFEEVTKGSGIASQALKDLLKVYQAAVGTEQAEQASKFIQAQLGAAASGLNTLLGGLQEAATVAAQASVQETIDAMTAKLALVEASIATATGSTRDAFEKVRDDLKKQIEAQEALKESTVGTFTVTAEQAAGLSAAVVGSFGAMMDEGLTFREAIDAIQPSLDILRRQLETAGIDGGRSFRFLAEMSDLANGKITGPLTDAISGANMALKGMHNAGMMNQEMFAAVALTATQAHAAIIKEGGDGNAALLLMQPTLQTIWALQEDFGYSVDAGTQKLIDQAIEAELVGEQHRNAQDKIAAAMEKVVDILARMAEHFGVRVPEAAARAGSAIETVKGKAGDLGGAVISIPWGEMGDRAEEAAGRAQGAVEGLAGAVNGVVEGNSPYGLVDIPPAAELMAASIVTASADGATALGSLAAEIERLRATLDDLDKEAQAQAKTWIDWASNIVKAAASAGGEIERLKAQGLATAVSTAVSKVAGGRNLGGTIETYAHRAGQAQFSTTTEEGELRKAQDRLRALSAQSSAYLSTEKEIAALLAKGTRTAKEEESLGLAQARLRTLSADRSEYLATEKQVTALQAAIDEKKTKGQIHDLEYRRKKELEGLGQLPEDYAHAYTAASAVISAQYTAQLAEFTIKQQAELAALGAVKPGYEAAYAEAVDLIKDKYDIMRDQAAARLEKEIADLGQIPTEYQKAYEKAALLVNAEFDRLIKELQGKLTSAFTPPRPTAGGPAPSAGGGGTAAPSGPRVYSGLEAAQMNLADLERRLADWTTEWTGRTMWLTRRTAGEDLSVLAPEFMNLVEAAERVGNAKNTVDELTRAVKIASDEVALFGSTAADAFATAGDAATGAAVGHSPGGVAEIIRKVAELRVAVPPMARELVTHFTRIGTAATDAGLRDGWVRPLDVAVAAPTAGGRTRDADVLTELKTLNHNLLVVLPQLSESAAKHGAQAAGRR